MSQRQAAGQGDAPVPSHLHAGGPERTMVSDRPKARPGAGGGGASAYRCYPDGPSPLLRCGVREALRPASDIAQWPQAIYIPWAALCPDF